MDRPKIALTRRAASGGFCVLARKPRHILPAYRRSFGDGRLKRGQTPTALIGFAVGGGFVFPSPGRHRTPGRLPTFLLGRALEARTDPKPP